MSKGMVCPPGFSFSRRIRRTYQEIPEMVQDTTKFPPTKGTQLMWETPNVLLFLKLLLAVSRLTCWQFQLFKALRFQLRSPHLMRLKSDFCCDFAGDFCDFKSRESLRL